MEGAKFFAGPIVTLKVYEDNVLIREFVEEKGHSRVLVVDVYKNRVHKSRATPDLVLLLLSLDLQ